MNRFRCVDKIKVLALATVGLSVLNTHVIAQDDEQDEEVTTLEELIILGTAGGQGISRIDASFAVTSLGAEDIEKIRPKSTADLLKAAPGIWAESSSGVAGANIDVRGLPGGSDAPFASFALEGSPLFGTNFLSFFEGSSIFRVDDTIKAVEVLRGGPTSVFGKGEPGATINFKLKEGGPETEGSLKYSTSDFGLQRVDGFLSGQIDEGLYYAVGGYITESPGIRDTGFTSEEGQQFSVNITKEFDLGKVNFYTRITDDHGQWVLPFAQFIRGIDVGTFTPLNNNIRFRELEVSSTGDTEIFDFSEGRGWDGSVSGANIEFDLGNGFTLRDNFNITSGDANTFGTVLAGLPITAGQLSDSFGGPIFTQTNPFEALSDEDLVQNIGHWIVFKDIESTSNDLSVSKEFNDRNTGTIGFYTSSFSSQDFWSLGNPIPIFLTQDNSDFLADADGNLLSNSDIVDAGGDDGFFFGLQSSGDARINAFYIADTWNISDAFKIDLGVRWEEIEIDYILDTSAGESVANPGLPRSIADGVNDLVFGDRFNDFAFTAAADYQVSETVGLFARFSDGFSFPNFDDIRTVSAGLRNVDQFEIGLKYAGSWIDVFATFYSNESEASINTLGADIGDLSVFSTESIGIEVEGQVRFGQYFGASFGGTFQDSEIVDSTNTADIGNTVLRQPDEQFRISPDFTFPAGTATISIYSSIALIGERFNSNDNVAVLDSFEKVDLGVTLDTAAGIFFQIHGDNIFDSDGVTEGDPRNPTSPAARPIFGRSVVFSVGYDF